MECKYCKGNCQKSGRQANGRQRYYCRPCKKYQQATYRYQARSFGAGDMTGRLLCEGVSIRGIARILKIAINTVLNQIRKAARLLLKPPISLQQEVLEVDELHTYIKSKKMNFG